MKISYLIDRAPLERKVKQTIQDQIKDVVVEAVRREIKEQTGKIMSNSKTKSIIKTILLIIGALVVVGAIAYVVYRFVICKKDEFDEEIEALCDDAEETECCCEKAEEATECCCEKAEEAAECCCEEAEEATECCCEKAEEATECCCEESKEETAE